MDTPETKQSSADRKQQQKSEKQKSKSKKSKNIATDAEHAQSSPAAGDAALNASLNRRPKSGDAELKSYAHAAGDSAVKNPANKAASVSNLSDTELINSGNTESPFPTAVSPSKSPLLLSPPSTKSGDNSDTSGSRSHSRCGRQHRSASKRKQKEQLEDASVQHQQPQQNSRAANLGDARQQQEAHVISAAGTAAAAEFNSATTLTDASFSSASAVAAAVVQHGTLPHPSDNNNTSNNSNSNADLSKRRNSRIDSMQPNSTYKRNTVSHSSDEDDSRNNINDDGVNSRNDNSNTHAFTDTLDFPRNFDSAAVHASAPLIQLQPTTVEANLFNEDILYLKNNKNFADEIILRNADDEQVVQQANKLQLQNSPSYLTGNTDDDRSSNYHSAAGGPDDDNDDDDDIDEFEDFPTNNFSSDGESINNTTLKQQQKHRQLSNAVSLPPQHTSATSSLFIVGGGEDYLHAGQSTYEKLATDQLRPVPIYPDPNIYNQETAALQPPSSTSASSASLVDSTTFSGDTIRPVDLRNCGDDVIAIGGAVFNKAAHEQGLAPSTTSEEASFLDYLSSNFSSNEISMDPHNQQHHSQHVHNDESYADAVKVPGADTAHVVPQSASVNRVNNDRQVPQQRAAVHLDSQKSFPALGAPIVPLDELEGLTAGDVIDGAEAIKTPLDAAHVVERLHEQQHVKEMAEHIEQHQGDGHQQKSVRIAKGRAENLGGNVADDEGDEEDDEFEDEEHNKFAERMAAAARVSGPGATPWVGNIAHARPAFPATTNDGTQQQQRPKSIQVTKSETSTNTAANKTPSSKSGTVTFANATTPSSAGAKTVTTTEKSERQSQQGGAGDASTVSSSTTKTSTMQNNDNNKVKGVAMMSTTTTTKVAAVPQQKDLPAGADTHGGVTRNVDTKMTKVKTVSTARGEPLAKSPSGGVGGLSTETLIYIGIGVAVVAVGGIVCWRMAAHRK